MCHQILIVDDDDAIRKLLRIELKMEGYRVEEAENAVDALVWMENHRPDLIVLDVVMPGMDGIEFAQELKRRYPDMPLISMSGGETVIPKELCLQLMECLGAVETLAKPFQASDLLSAVKRLLNPGTKK